MLLSGVEFKLEKLVETTTEGKTQWVVDENYPFYSTNIRIAVNRNGSVFRCRGKASILHRTFHNAVHIIGLFAVSIDLVLIQTAKGIQPAVIFGVNRNIFAARGRVVNNIPRGILSTVCQAALELDVDLFRLLRSAKIVRTIFIFPELIELNVISVRLVFVKIAVTSVLSGFSLATISPSTMVLPITWAY